MTLKELKAIVDANVENFNDDTQVLISTKYGDPQDVRHAGVCFDPDANIFAFYIDI